MSDETPKIEDHADCVKVVAMVSHMLEQYDIQGSIERGARALGVGAVFHPSAWIEKHRALEEDLELLRAALPLVALARKIRERMAQGG